MKLDRVQVAGAVLLLAGILFVVSVNVSEAVYPGYSVSQNWVSDLGATCVMGPDYMPVSCTHVQPASDIFRTSIGVAGVLSLCSAYLLLPVARSRWLVVLIGLGGVGLLGLSIFDMASNVPHVLFSMLGFTALVIATVYSSRFVHRPLSFVWLGLGLVALTAMLILFTVGGEVVAPIWAPLGNGGMERMLVYPLALWGVSFGSTLVTSPQDLVKPSGMPEASRAPSQRIPA